MARLPQPGGDNGSWGTILNEYLLQAHNPNGTLKDDSIGSQQLADAVVTESHLATPVQTKLNQTAPTWTTLTGKPAVVASGADQTAARNSIGAVGRGELAVNPYDYGAVGNGVANDTAALQSAYAAAVAAGGGAVLLPKGTFNIPDNLVMETPGVSLLGYGGVVTGGEVIVGPATYGAGSSGVDFSGTRVYGVIFNRGNDYGTTRCLVLRNVRGLDIEDNRFVSAGKGIAVEQADGNTKFHTTAMINISKNRFARLTFGIFCNTDEWDRLSDWQITDNFFNYCSDTSVWIACTDGVNLGGVDGLNFAGNTIFSLNYNSSTDPLFAVKRHNLRLGKTNWLRIINNNFFEAGLSAVYLDTPQNLAFIGNHIAWPGQREFGDCLEIHNGSPKGIIESNTFALWTRAAIGLYDLSQLYQLEIGQNGWNWSANPDSWKGTGSIVISYRIYASSGGIGYPAIRDFQATGVYDNLKGNSRIQSRDVKSPKGGVAGSSRRGLPVSATTTIFGLADISTVSSFGGLISITAFNSSDTTLIATYLLFVSSQGAVCTTLASGGHTTGAAAGQPSFTWTLSGSNLQATPVGSTNGSFNFDAVSLGAVAAN